jgi:hypothetical protein
MASVCLSPNFGFVVCLTIRNGDQLIELKMRFTGKIVLRVDGVTAFQQLGTLKAA